jgi:hypothetical protein
MNELQKLPKATQHYERVKLDKFSIVNSIILYSILSPFILKQDFLKIKKNHNFIVSF